MAATRITVYVRHKTTCPLRKNEFAKGCGCRKWLRWTQDGIRLRRNAETSSWTEAEKLAKEIQAEVAGEYVEETDKGTAAAVEVFLAAQGVKGVTTGTLGKYRLELGRLVAHCDRHSIFTVQRLTPEILVSFMATWKTLYPATGTRIAVRARLRTFLRFCYESKWLSRIPPMPTIQPDKHNPTMPLTADEYGSLIQATNTFEDVETRQRSHALFRLMRYTGLALGDSLKLLKTRMTFDKKRGRWRVATARQKTGTWVSVIIPTDLAKELQALPKEWKSSANGSLRRVHPDYFFWDGLSDIVNTWSRKTVPKAFKVAQIERAGNMTSHRLRDTFACGLLEKGVPLEEVSKLLGHKSIKTTERSYSPWVKGRQDRLDELVIDALIEA